MTETHYQAWRDRGSEVMGRDVCVCVYVGGGGYMRVNLSRGINIMYSHFMIRLQNRGHDDSGPNLALAIPATPNGIDLLFLGPITSVLLTFCSFRLIGTIGGVLVGLGYVLIGLVASSPILHIMFSIIAGIQLKK